MAKPLFPDGRVRGGAPAPIPTWAARTPRGLSPGATGNIHAHQGGGAKAPFSPPCDDIHSRRRLRTRVGCGTALDYEVLTKAHPTIQDVGADSSNASIEVARKLCPAGHFPTGSAPDLPTQFEARRFEVVLMRHAIEHVPDFAPAMEHALTLARRFAIFVCFLSPRSFPLGIPKVNPRVEPPFCTYAYS
jgi:SAM-dependent methyltransferase